MGLLRATSSTTFDRLGRPVFTALAAAALAAAGIAFATSADAADPVIDLGTAKAFSVLAGSGVTNTGLTTLAGSLGSYSTPTVSTDTTLVFTGTAAQNHAGDDVTQQAKQDLLVAYNAAAEALLPTAVPEELTRRDPYLPGIYQASSSMFLSGSMTLDGGGRNDGVFVFQAPSSTLKTASNSTVLFVNGAQPCNVYWQVGSSATFGTGTKFVGNVLAHTSITANNKATFQGRLLANEGAVTLESNTFTDPACDTTGGTDTDTTGGTDTDTDTTGGTDTDTDTTGGTDTDTDTTGGTDTDTTGGTDSDTTSDSDTGTNLGTDSDANAAADSDTFTVNQNGNSDLPSTGGPSGILVPIGLLATTIGYMLMLLRGRTRIGRHRA